MSIDRLALCCWGQELRCFSKKFGRFGARIFDKRIHFHDDEEQCDQFVFSIYLAIYCNENLPKSIQIVPMWFENFAQKPINLKYIAKYLRKWWNFAKSGHTDEEEM